MRLFRELQSQGLSKNFSVKIIIVFLGSFTEDATCNLDFAQGKNYRYDRADPAEGHRAVSTEFSNQCDNTSFVPWCWPKEWTSSLLIPELGRCRHCSWEASRRTRKQICKFYNFGVEHLHTTVGTSRWATGPERGRCVIWSHPHTGKGVNCCSAVLGKWEFLAGITHQVGTRLHHAVWGHTCEEERNLENPGLCLGH